MYVCSRPSACISKIHSSICHLGRRGTHKGECRMAMIVNSGMEPLLKVSHAVFNHTLVHYALFSRHRFEERGIQCRIHELSILFSSPMMLKKRLMLIILKGIVYKPEGKWSLRGSPPSFILNIVHDKSICC
jgi:hypothetical protein